LTYGVVWRRTVITDRLVRLTKEKSMYQLLYKSNMMPVETGDVVHFSNRAWTVEEICASDSYLSCWAWVRSMDEQRLCIRVGGGQFDATFTLTR